MNRPGTPENPLRVAIIGAGPSGFYAAERLQQTEGLEVQIDMFERLPTPYGLVRSGVAPDHQKIKSVTKQYEAVAAQESFRFFGGVEFGKHLTREDLTGHYDAVIYAVGTATARGYTDSNSASAAAGSPVQATVVTGPDDTPAFNSAGVPSATIRPASMIAMRSARASASSR